MHPGGLEYEIRDVKSEISRKADKHEIHTLNSRVDSLERTLSNLSSTVNEIFSRLQTVEETQQLITDTE